MRFIIHAKDKPEAKALRLEVLAAHRAYLEHAPSECGIEVLLSGPLTDDTGSEMIGSFFLLEAPDRGYVTQMLASDPLVLAGVWQSHSIDVVFIRQDNISASGEAR